MSDIHEQFIVECRELIHQANDDLIAVEREGVSSARIDRIFRAFHTLKGSAGVVELPAMMLTLHAAEDLLAAIHGGRLGVGAAIIDQALACLDLVARWVDAFEAHGAVPLSAGEDAREMAARLRALLPGSGAERQTTATLTDVGRGGSGLPAQWIARLIETGHEAIVRHSEQQPAGVIFALSYEPRQGCFFDGDDPLALIRRMPNLLAFHIEPREPWPPLADMDPFACNLRLQAISGGSRAMLDDIFRLVPDQIRIVEIPLAALAPMPATRIGDGDSIAFVCDILNEQRRVLTASGQGDDMQGRIGAVAQVAVNALRHCGAAVQPHAGAVEAAAARADAAELLSVLDDILANLTSGTPAGLDEARRRPAASANPEDDIETVRHTTTRSLRVDEARIDALFNLAGELIVAKNGFSHLARRIEAEFGGHEMARAVKREQEALERLAGEMQAAILQLRMVPVSNVFRSFPRLVRDMAQRLEKSVALVTQGETAELDKTIVERLFEPLLHLIRNALDHGVESAEQRRAANKPETATVTLQAARTGDRFVVDVSDDGGGIDPQIIGRRALDRGLVTASELAAMSEGEVIELIFAAGFSTASEISDISGRGVGMDVVRATMEQIGGRVSLTSSPGIGTTVRLDLPLNIAMTRIMVAEAGGQVFGIPMDAVAETVRLTPDRIRQIKTNEGFVLRDRVIPICSLGELMDLPRQRQPGSGSRLLVVIEAGGKTAAIEVEAIRDRLDVVLKPMQGLIANARGYAGTTLLGDGQVLLVLDVKEMLP